MNNKLKTVGAATAIAAGLIIGLIKHDSADNELIINDEKLVETEEISETEDIDLNSQQIAEDISEAESTPQREIIVFVCGEVIKPDVYALNEGSRIYDAVNAAGGFTQNAAADYLNLAAYLSDGMRVYVPSYEEAENADNSFINETEVFAADNEKSSLININTATKTELLTLSGIGEAKAAAIISYRESKGGFSSTEDIMNVEGIKEGMYNKIKDYICVR